MANRLPLTATTTTATAVATPVTVGQDGNNNNNNSKNNPLLVHTGYNAENGLFDTDRVSLMGYRTPLHRFFVAVSIAAGLTGVNNIVAQLVALWFAGNPPMEVILRLYMIGLFVVVVLNEAELTTMIRESKILNKFVARGFFYSFLGVLGVVEYDVGVDNRLKRRGYNNGRNSYSNSSSGYNNNGFNGPYMPSGEDFGEWYLFLVSWLMILMGLLYVVLGAFCLQQKLEYLRQEYQQRQNSPKPVYPAGTIA